MFSIQAAIQKIVRKQNLSAGEMTEVMRAMMNGEVTPAQFAGFLVAMHMKGETVEELVAAIKVLREFMLPVNVSGAHLIDIVGTGGDHAQTFNVSTSSALIVAAAGGRVAKHGNRSLSSSSGSADVLEKAGVNLTLTPDQIADCIAKIGIGFMFAPQHHTAMKHALAPRKELSIRTFFNLIGPLTNPARVTHQLMGVFAKEWCEPIAEVLQQLGSEHAMVVHSEDGLDEISIAAPTFVAELKNNKIKTYRIDPSEFGIKHSAIDELKVKSAQESLAMMQTVLNNKPGAARDIVALNAGAAIYIAGLAKDLATGIDKALVVIASGAALEKLQQLVEFTKK